MDDKNTDIKKIIGENIAFLRKNSKLTQLELADKLHYSDKAISKWERGESAPDYDSLLLLSKLFNVQVDYFFYESNKDKSQFLNKENNLKVRELLTTITLCITALSIAIAIFLIAWFRDNSLVSSYWIAFLWAVPLCLLFLVRYFIRNKHRLGIIITLSLFLWTLLTCIFLQLVLSSINAWMIYLIGIPLEAEIIIYNFVKK